MFEMIGQEFMFYFQTKKCYIYQTVIECAGVPKHPCAWGRPVIPQARQSESAPTRPPFPADSARP